MHATLLYAIAICLHVFTWLCVCIFVIYISLLDVMVFYLFVVVFNDRRVGLGVNVYEFVVPIPGTYTILNLH